MKWKIKYFSDSVQSEILDLPAGMLARYLRFTDMMEIYGPNLGMPYTRAMGDGLFELRLKSAEGISRVFFCMISEQTIIILHSFIKKTHKTPQKEFDIARRRMKEVKNDFT